MNLSREEEVFFASVIGDGSLSFNNGKYIIYSEHHTLRQKDYLLWKLKYLLRLFNFANSPYCFDKFDKRTKKIYPHIKIHSSDSRLKKYRKLFYPDGKKILPKKVLYSLTPLGLAVWYMDDGTYVYYSKESRIATDHFDYDTNIMIQKFFREKFDIYIRVQRKEEKYNLVLNVENTTKFLKLIKPYIHKSMIYKLGHLHPNNSERVIEGWKKLRKNKTEYYLKNKERMRLKGREYSRRYREKKKDEQRNNKTRA